MTSLVKKTLVILLLLPLLIGCTAVTESNQSFRYSDSNYKLTKAFLSFGFFGNIKANQLTLEIEPGDRYAFNNSYIKTDKQKYTEKKTNVLNNGTYMQLTFLTPDISAGQTVYWYLDDNLTPIQIKL